MLASPCIGHKNLYEIIRDETSIEAKCSESGWRNEKNSQWKEGKNTFNIRHKKSL
jgi:hypothetical protein